MSDITLSSGIRQNLLSLQQTSADLTTTQEALATGKAVNSASDNPSAYFTSQTLTNNANALSALLDQIGQGSQTISAADNGLTGVTSLLQQALSTATQAQQSATGTLTYSAITGTGTIGADSTQVTGNTFSTTGLTAATLSTTTATDGNIAGLSAGTASTTSATDADIANVGAGDKLVFQVGSNAAVTATQGTDFTTGATLASYLTTQLGSEATVSDSGGTLTITSNTVGTSGDIATVTGNGAAAASFSAPTTGTAASTLVFQVGSNAAVTATYGTNFTSGSTLATYLTAQLGSQATVTDSGGNLSVTSNLVGTNVDTVGGTGATGAGFSTPTTSTAGSSLVLTDAGGANSTLYYVNSADTSNAEAATNGTFSNLTELVDAINGAGNTSSEITASSVNGGTQLQLANHSGTTGSITVGGDVGASLGFNTTAYDNNYNSSLAAAVNGNQTLTIQVGTDTAHTLTFGTGTGQISTLAGLNTALSGISDVTATVNGSGKLVLTPTSTDAITVGGSANATIGLATSTTPNATVVTANSTRATLQTNFNNLLTQINQLASDASYNGVNLLSGNNLTVDFNQAGTSSLTIQGVNDSSTGLGLSQLNNNEFQDDATISTIITNLNNAISSVQAQTETFGTNASTITTRQTFETNLINTLQTGASNLVAADQNQESANLLTEQTQQQLEISALSIANQANQSVLKLFG
jgi:flagellin-like hook-associated protein FlgL